MTQYIKIHCDNNIIRNDFINKIYQSNFLQCGNTKQFIDDLWAFGKDFCSGKDICCNLIGTDFYLYTY